MKYILAPADGERLTLGPPAAGELLIKAQPPEGFAGYVAGTLALRPGALIPRCRCLQTDTVWFVYKGQGRVTVGAETATVVPGMLVHVPRATWHMFRNTGTGLLQLILWAHPAGLDAFYRELAALGPSASLDAMAAAGQRYGIEFDAQSSAGEPPQASGRHRRPRRRRSPRQGERSAAASAPAAPITSFAPALPAPAVTPAPVVAPARAPRVTAGDRPRRRHRRRARGPGRPQPSATSQAPTPQAATPQAVPSPGAEPVSTAGPVKEVYMNGRWVRVSGEGPVIAPGRERRPPRREHRRRPPRSA